MGTLIPVIGASGFAAAAGAAGTVAGSVAVAASFGGTNMRLDLPDFSHTANISSLSFQVSFAV